MLYNYDIAVINDDLPGKEYRGLEAFTKRHRNFRRIRRGLQTRPGKEIRDGYSRGVRGNDAPNAGPEEDHDKRSTQPYESFENQVFGEIAKAAHPLNESATCAQRNIKRGSNGQQNY